MMGTRPHACNLPFFCDCSLRIEARLRKRTAQTQGSAAEDASSSSPQGAEAHGQPGAGGLGAASAPPPVIIPSTTPRQSTATGATAAAASTSGAAAGGATSTGLPGDIDPAVLRMHLRFTPWVGEEMVLEPVPLTLTPEEAARQAAAAAEAAEAATAAAAAAGEAPRYVWGVWVCQYTVDNHVEEHKGNTHMRSQ
jgi:hypothetical protein